jgi:two-component sensor histidine kinase
VVLLFRDVTDRRRTEAALKDADRRKDEFLAMLAHELRNPLAPLLNALDLLRQTSDDPTVAARAREITERQVGLIVRLVEDLLDVRRITRGYLEIRRERIELAAVLQRAVEASRPAIEASGHERTVIPLPERAALNADPDRPVQVFTNLLNNAARYTERGGQIWLTAERQAAEVVVSVRDTGVGIAPANLGEIFEMSSQAEPALERSRGGASASGSPWSAGWWSCTGAASRPAAGDRAPGASSSSACRLQSLDTTEQGVAAWIANLTPGGIPSIPRQGSAGNRQRSRATMRVHGERNESFSEMSRSEAQRRYQNIIHYQIRPMLGDRSKSDDDKVIILKRVVREAHRIKYQAGAVAGSGAREEIFDLLTPLLKATAGTSEELQDWVKRAIRSYGAAIGEED